MDATIKKRTIDLLRVLRLNLAGSRWFPRSQEDFIWDIFLASMLVMYLIFFIREVLLGSWLAFSFYFCAVVKVILIIHRLFVWYPKLEQARLLRRRTRKLIIDIVEKFHGLN